jgi:hypothetical protein
MSLSKVLFGDEGQVSDRSSRHGERSPLLNASRSHRENVDDHAVTVLYIAGFGRSGSTLLDRILGSTPGLHSGGELGAVWVRGLVEERLCSCGICFSDCPFWQAVVNNAFSSLPAHEVDAIVRYMDRVLPVQKMWRLLTHRTRQKLVSSAPANFLGMTTRLYQGVRDVSTRQVVVDSSKSPTYLLLLAQVSSVNVHVVHLVRDPRAVAHSWQRPRVAEPDGRSSMPRFGAVKSAVLWLIINVAVEWTARQLDFPYVRVRYEDLVQGSSQIVGQLRSEVLTDPEFKFKEAGHLDDEDNDLGVVHSISGNPMRFRQGRMSIAEDVDWKGGPRSRRAIVAAVTFPLRWRYGYGGHTWRSHGSSRSKNAVQSTKDH